MNYNLDFDYAAIILMGMFFFYYYSRRRFQTMQNMLFLVLAYSVLLSIILDIGSSFSILYSAYVPAVVIYFFAILYFIVTGAMALIFCIYALGQSGSDNIFHKMTGKMFILFLPYTLFILALITTPLTKLIFYVDENNEYQQGPFMISMLVLVIVYLVFSFFRITFFSDNFSFRKRLPYYSFMLFMIISVILQWILKDYLLYGFAESLGTIVLYLSNHNSNDLIDIRTDLYNRKTASLKLVDIKKAGKSCVLIGITVPDSEFGRNNTENEATHSSSDSFASQLALFLRQEFGIQNSYCIENGVYMIITDSDNAEKVIATISNRFLSPWKLRDNIPVITPGIAEIIYPADSSQVNQAFDFLVEGSRHSLENSGKIMHKDDIVDEKERRINSLVKQREILEKQYLETEYKMNKALNADKSKSIFLAQMSHEIRTPMTAILGMTELILRHTKDKKVVEYSSSIMNSGRNLLGIINDILDFSKIESGKLNIVNDKYMISSVIYDIVTGIEQRIADKHLDFRVRFDESIPDFLFGDEIRVKQIMFNILTNACKYTERGSVTFTVGGSRRADYFDLKIEVTDTGIGIKSENIPHLFEGFERFDLQKNKTIEGTGLGLAIVKQLLELMNGYVEVSSEYGLGTTFTIVIPQKIIDDTPSVNLNNIADKYFAVYFEKPSYVEDATRSLESLKIKYDVISSFNELCNIGAEDKYTDILIYCDTYKKLKETGNLLTYDKRLIVSVMYGDYLPGYDKRVLHMPLCSLNLGTFLNGTSLRPNLDNINCDGYTAPDARILVVDDNAVNLRIFTNLIEPHKFIVDAVDSGNACIEKTMETKYDIVFLDHMMPQKDGIETIREILSSDTNPNRETPFVAFTANAITGMKDMFLKIGFKDFLSKPIDISKLEEILSLYLPPEKILLGQSVDETEDSSSDEAFGRKLSECGLNMEVALACAGGMMKTLRSVLEVFCADGKKKHKLMFDYIDSKNYDSFQIEIHAVKSLCKGIGVEELSERARLLEFACKDKNYTYVDNNYEGVLNDYGNLIKELETVLNDSVSTNHDTEETFTFNMTFNEMLLCLDILLKNFEQEAAEHLVLDLQHAGQTDDEKMLALSLKKLLDLYDFTGASEKIEEVLGTV